MITCSSCAHRFASPGPCPRCGAPGGGPASPPGGSVEAPASELTVLRDRLQVPAPVSAPIAARTVSAPVPPFSGSAPDSPVPAPVAPLPAAPWLNPPPAQPSIPASEAAPAVPTQSPAPDVAAETPQQAQSRSAGQGPQVAIPRPTAPLSIGRGFNALCYIATGLFLFVAGFASLSRFWYGPLIGLAVAAYGMKILLTRSSYWITWYIYLLPLAGLGFLVFTFHH